MGGSPGHPMTLEEEEEERRTRSGDQVYSLTSSGTLSILSFLHLFYQ